MGQSLAQCPHSSIPLGFNSFIAAGGTIAYTKGAETLLEDLKDVRPTACVYVPRVMEKLYEGVMAQLRNAPGSKKAMFNLALGVGGAPLSDEINAFFQIMGIEAHLGYGLTETTPVTHLNTFKYLKPIKLGTCGPIFPRTECKAAGDGEIMIRGPQVMKGYYNRPQDTKEVLTADGWFYTGDIGLIDEDGYLRITDRKKDIIITAGGKNVAPQVIEGMFTTHPLIEQLAIIGDQR